MTHWESKIAWMYAVSLALGFLTLGITIVIFCEPLYHMAIDWFRIEATTGLAYHQLAEEYHALIQYLTRPWIEPLQLRYFISSPSGLFHFFEVKQLFLYNFIICIVVACVNGWLFTIFKRQQSWRCLVKPLRWMMLAPIGIIVLIGLFFDQLFMAFHQVFFNNDAWIFNPLTDPIIYALPQEFFMLCFLCVFVFLLSLLGVFSRYVRKKSDIQTRSRG